jgi:hypothetical protein
MFRNEPESLGGLAGCLFWVVFFAAAMAVFLKALHGLAGGAA